MLETTTFVETYQPYDSFPTELFWGQVFLFLLIFSPAPDLSFLSFPSAMACTPNPWQSRPEYY